MEWERYFQFTKIGHKISIDKVYKKPKGKETKYGLVGELEELIINILIKDQSGELLLPKSKLFLLLNMVNENYNYARYHIPKLSLLTDVSEDEIQEFYGLSKESLTSSIEAAFKSLRKKSLLIKEDILTVCLIDPKIKSSISDSGIKVNREVTGTDEYGENEYKYDIDYSINRIHREANKIEKDAILAAESIAVKELTGANDKRKLFINGQWKQYIERVKEILFNDFNILYYYNSYRLTFNKENIGEIFSELEDYRLSQGELDLKNENVNDKIKVMLVSNANHRHLKAKDIVKENGETVKKKYTVREQIDYLKNTNKLVDTLIDDEASNIKKEIQNINLSNQDKET